MYNIITLVAFLLPLVIYSFSLRTLENAASSGGKPRLEHERSMYLSRFMYVRGVLLYEF